MTSGVSSACLVYSVWHDFQQVCGAWGSSSTRFTQALKPKVPPVCAGFLSPAIRGALLTALLVMYLLLAVAAGFASVWLWGIIHRSYEGWWVLHLALLRTHEDQLACSLPLLPESACFSCASAVASMIVPPAGTDGIARAAMQAVVPWVFPVMSGCHVAAFAMPAPPKGLFPAYNFMASPSPSLQPDAMLP